jgi:hypothetical protein
MRRFMTVLGMALLGYAFLPTAAQAQVIYVQPPRVYAPPVFYTQPVVPTYYAAPSVTTYSAPATYSYYPPSGPVYSYSAPTTVYSAPPSVVTYAAPAQVIVPASGIITTRTSYGYGIFRPRGYYSQSYYTPLR